MVVAIVTGLAIVATAVLAGAAATAGRAFTVTSTLDGKSVLPHRIAWLARTSLTQAKVSEVAFLIDGKVRWVEHGAPYSYSDDGGNLVTSWLAPGRHRFTVRAKSTDGRQAARTVVARIAAALEPPPALAGTWQRDVQGTPETLGGPPGTYTLWFDKRWIRDRAPGKWNPATGSGGVVNNDWVPGPKTFEIAGAVTFRILRDDDQEGGWWCEPGGPKATYTWSVSGDTLTLSPVDRPDPCRERGAVYTGEWTRAG